MAHVDEYANGRLTGPRSVPGCPWTGPIGKSVSYQLDGRRILHRWLHTRRVKKTEGHPESSQPYFFDDLNVAR